MDWALWQIEIGAQKNFAASQAAFLSRPTREKTASEVMKG
jgi:hypothetical protein